MAQAANTAGALKQYIEGLGLQIMVYRDRAPIGKAAVKPPYITIDEAVSVTPKGMEDGGVDTVTEQATVDLWMPWRTTDTGKMAESSSLPAALIKALHGAQLVGGSPIADLGPEHVYSVLVRIAGPRLVEEESNLVHYPITVDVERKA